MTTWEQLPLFRTAPQRVHLHLAYDAYVGPWTLTCTVGRSQRNGEVVWERQTYERMTAEEALDVLCALGAAGLGVDF
jgi:hypothetical protein